MMENVKAKAACNIGVSAMNNNSTKIQNNRRYYPAGTEKTQEPGTMNISSSAVGRQHRKGGATLFQLAYKAVLRSTHTLTRQDKKAADLEYSIRICALNAQAIAPYPYTQKTKQIGYELDFIDVKRKIYRYRTATCQLI